MTTRLPRLFLAGLGLFVVLAIPSADAAVSPRSRGELKKQSSHIVSGKVLDVTSMVQKSAVEKAVGIHRDRVYTIKVLVKAVSKGAGVKAGDEIEVLAWKPLKRIPPLPGPQGHESIPKKGNAVTLFLTGRKGKSFQPILPNGIVIDPGG